MNSVLDSSALIALMNAQPGADRVASAVLSAAAMTTVNLTETVAFLARRSIAEEDIRRQIARASITFVAFDEALAFDTGLLEPITRGSGLSLGDRACLALGRRLRVPVLTADRQWQSVAGQLGVQLQLVR